MNAAAMTLARLAQFGHARRGKDLGTVIQVMTHDCELRPSGRPERGATFTAREDVCACVTSCGTAPRDIDLLVSALASAR